MLISSVYTKRWALKNPEKYKAGLAKNNATRKANGNLRRWYLNRKYGMTPEQWGEMLEKQNGKCAICQEVSTKWHTDHDHATGKVRGILCHLCNRIVLPAIEHYQALLADGERYLRNSL